MNTNGCQPPNCPCFCPSAELPIAPVVVGQGGPAGVIQIPIFGTQPFQVSITTNPTLPIGLQPLISSAQIFNGNVLTITTAVPVALETIGTYVAVLQVCNACGTLTIQIEIEVVADITPVLTDCVLAQALWTPLARVPAVGDTLLAFTPTGCHALLPPTAVACPLLASCNGSCLAPAYSFASAPTSGMWMNAGVLTLSTANCTDLIEIGNSIDLSAATSFIRLRGGYAAPGTNCGVIIETNGVEQLRIGSLGAWNLHQDGGGNMGEAIISQDSGAPPIWGFPSGLSSDNGTSLISMGNTGITLETQAASWIWTATGALSIEGSVGTAGQVLTSNGAPSPPTWQAGGGVSFPVLAPNGTCAAPSYGFTASPDSGMFYTGAAIRISDDNCVDYVEVGASINLVTASGLGPTIQMNSLVSYILVEADQTEIKGKDGSNTTGTSVIIHGSDFVAAATAGSVLIAGGFSPTRGGDVNVNGGVNTGAGQAGHAQLTGGTDSAGIGTPGNAVVRGGANVGAAPGGNAFVISGTGTTAIANSGDVILARGNPTAPPFYIESLRIKGSTGEWQLAGSPGAAGERLTSQGPGLPPIWAV